MLGRGLKRKLEPEEEEESGVMKPGPQETCFWLQRQTVLNLSLLKLHGREPGLSRRVLITNTLRRIQDVPEPRSFPAGVSLPQEDGRLSLCRSPAVSGQPPPPASLLKDGFTSALAGIEDLPDAGELRHAEAGLSETGGGADSASSLSDSGRFGHAPSLLADFSLDDFLFTELDSLLFDNAPCGPALNASSGASKVVSMVTDDLVKTLAGYGSGGASQSDFRLDLSELDHIMEVLVGS
ncbi:SERTA domain-containing protein 2 [Puntigrus tetrazona]|uniref:SERTA domain-containing protein 2 n=1 Tax=Puntigrus tetrazona TaxID=1606681 RepID=UPI001C899ABD|nr:SERTA domain-containing protein 2 [Puntigrus tetrazona]